MEIEPRSAPDPAPVESVIPAQPLLPQYPGFWRRIFAVVIDTTLLGVVGEVLGLFFAEKFIPMGQSGRWIGVVIAGAYYIPCHLLSGQTLGKWLLGIRVQRLDGAPLTAANSVIRYCAFAVPWFANGLYFSGDGMPRGVLIVLGVILASVLFVGIFGDIYLLLLNRPARRLLHDFIAGTVVVRTAADRVAVPLSDRRLALGHRIAIALIFVAIIGGAYWLSIDFPIKDGQLADLRDAQTALERLPGVTQSGLTDGWETFNGNKRHVVYIRLWVSHFNAPPMPPLARSAVMIVVDKYPESKSANAISVTLVSGFDIGIASRWHQFGDSHPPADW